MLTCEMKWVFFLFFFKVSITFAGFPEILREVTHAILENRPLHIYRFLANHLEEKLTRRALLENSSHLFTGRDLHLKLISDHRLDSTSCCC